MVTSPSSSPPPKWNSNAAGAGRGSGLLLHELEALSQALYQSQRKAPPSHSYASQPPPHPQPQPRTQPSPASKLPFSSRKDGAHSGRRLSHDPSTDQAASLTEPIPYSNLSSHDPPPSFTNLLSRHSLSSAQAPPPSSFEQQKSTASNPHPRFSSSVISSHKSSRRGEDKSEVRSRIDRRLSLHSSPSKNQEKYTPQGQQDWAEDSFESSSRRFDSSSSDKKKSVWSWKPFRALSHLGRQRVHCVFSAYVHAIEGLSPAMNGLRLCVHMRKEETKEGAVQTMPSRVFQGIAEFQETLFMKCTLYSSKGSSNTMKFMEKAFLVSVIAPDIDELDFGKHQVDLSKLLGDSIDERNGQLEKGNSWDTMLDLTGKARGGKLAITFNYEILDKDSSFSGNASSRFQESPPHRSSLQFSFSLPNSAHGTPRNITTRAHLSHSPCASEPSNDYDDLLAMDQLNLDEPPPAPTVHPAQELKGDHIADVQGFPAFRSHTGRPPVPSQGAFNAFPSYDSKLNTEQISLPSSSLERVFDRTIIKKQEDSGEDDDFVVVDHGMEFDESVEKHPDNVITEKEINSAEEEASDDLIPRVVEMDAMDDLPQAVGIESRRDLPPRMADMEALDDHSPNVVKLQAFDNPTPLGNKMETLDIQTSQEAPSQVSEKASHDFQEENLFEEEPDAEQQDVHELDAADSSVDEKEVHADVEKIVTVDEGDRKDNVTYMTVMETLDSLLQGTSARELPQEEEKVEVESSADGIFSDEEEAAADKEVINVTSLSKLENTKVSDMELNDDAFGTMKNGENDGSENEDIEDRHYDGSENEDIEDRQNGSRDIREITVSGIRREEANALEEEERHSNVSGSSRKGGMHVREGVEGSCSTSEDEGVHNNKHSEEERETSVFEDQEVYDCKHAEDEYAGNHVSKEEDSCNVDIKEKEMCANVKEEGLGGFEDVESGGEENSSDVDIKGKDMCTDVREEKDTGGFEDVESGGEDDSSDVDIKGKEMCTDVREEKDLGGFEDVESVDENGDSVPNIVAENQSESISSNAEVSPFKESTDRKFDDAVHEDMKIEVGSNSNTESLFKESSGCKLDDAIYDDIDTEVDLVAGEFLDMLDMGNTSVSNNCESEVDSPRARLLKEFEEETLLKGSFGLGFDDPEFLLDGASRDEGAGIQPTASEDSSVKGLDKQPNFTLTLTQVDKESTIWDHAYASNQTEKKASMWNHTPFQTKEETAKWDEASSLRGLSNGSANLDHTTPFEMTEREHQGWDQMKSLKAVDAQPIDLDSTTALKEMDKEPSNQDHTLPSKGMDRELAVHHRTLGLKEMDKTTTDVDIYLAIGKETVVMDHASAWKLKDEEPASYTDTSALKRMQEQPINSGMKKKPMDRDECLPSVQMDKVSFSWDHTSALKKMEDNSVSWNESSAFKRMDEEIFNPDHTSFMKGMHKKPADGDVHFPSNEIDNKPPNWDCISASGKLDKEPSTRAPDRLSDAVESEPAAWSLEDDEELMSFLEAAESELQRATQSNQSKSRAKMLEDEETEALMQEWGLNEKSFMSSPPRPTSRQQEPPPLGKGLGVTVPLKDGGSLRSMNPSLFQANKNSGKLVMQISKPVVVPSDMGTETSDILRNMASMGIENMAVQAMTAMPLEDITGRSVEQVAIEGMTASNSGHRFLEGPSGSRKELMSRFEHKSRTSQNIVDEFVTLEDIAPMAMQQIEALALDGLKIQADAVDDETPFTYNAFSVESQSGGRDMSTGSAILKGVTGISLSKGLSPSAETSGNNSGNGLMGMAISLDEWMLLDAGLYDEAETNKDALAIMAAHHVTHQELVMAGDDDKKKKRQGSKNAGSRWGCMGNSLTIAMLVQLRDPLKNNEAVGAPMMAFVQAERMMKPPKMKVGRNVTMKRNNEDDEATEEPQFQITGIHMAGMKAPQEEKKISWGNQKQLQSGSRWLIANGMTKNAKINRPMLGSKPAMASSASSGKANPNKGESLWSISSRALSSGLNWRDKFKFNASARN